MGILRLFAVDRERVVKLYDAGVRHVDAQVGRVLDALRERARERDVILMLTTDHGEEFWDHGGLEHGHDFYAEVSRAPDRGVSLVGQWDETHGSERGKAERMRFCEANLYGLQGALVETASWRFLLRANGEAELFAADADPRDRHNLVWDRPEGAAALAEVLASRLQPSAEGEGRAAELSLEAL